MRSQRAKKKHTSLFSFSSETFFGENSSLFTVISAGDGDETMLKSIESTSARNDWAVLTYLASVFWVFFCDTYQSNHAWAWLAGAGT